MFATLRGESELGRITTWILQRGGLNTADEGETGVVEEEGQGKLEESWKGSGRESAFIDNLSSRKSLLQ